MKGSAEKRSCSGRKKKATCQMEEERIPPGFKVFPVPGGGNCFYYSLGPALNGFEKRYLWKLERIERFKKHLLKKLDKSTLKKDADERTVDALTRRLRTPDKFAQEPEVALTAEVLNLCIYVFSYDPKNPRPWLVVLHVPPLYREEVYKNCPETKSYTAEELKKARFPCSTSCGEHKPIFLLHDKRAQHYQPLQVTAEKSSPVGGTTVPKQSPKTAAVAPLHKPAAPPAVAPLHKEEPPPAPVLKKQVSFAASPPRRLSDETRTFLGKYLKLVERQLQLADAFMKKNDVADKELLDLYKKVTAEWVTTASKLSSSRT